MEWGNLAQIGSVLLALGAIVNGWISSRSKASADAHAKLAEKVISLETGMAEIRRDVQHLPDAAATHRQELMIQEIKGKMDVLSERLKPVADISNRLQEFLLDQAKGDR